MSAPPEPTPASRLTPLAALICVIAAIGFMFDTYVLLMAPLVIPRAIESLEHLQPGSEEFRRWVSLLFYVPAVCGGIFGLYGGYLTDLFGRRRVLVWSILIYAFGSLGAAYSTSLVMLLVLRFAAFVGVCVEFVAAVAWLAELFPAQKQREAVLGWTQATASLGGVAVTGLYEWLVPRAADLPAILGTHDAWRYLEFSGVIPAIPLILIRPFLPESPAWAEKKAAGTLRRPSLGEIFAPHLKRTTIVSTVMMAAVYGVAFAAIQQLPQIVPGLREVTGASRAEFIRNMPPLQQLPPPQQGQLAGKMLPIFRMPEARRADAIRALPEISALPPEQQEDVLKAYPAAARLARQAQEKSVAGVQAWQERGGLLGRVALALLAVWIVSRRRLLWIFQIPGAILIPIIFFYAPGLTLEMITYGAFAAGFFNVAQFSFWGNYLPRVYPVHLRGTGESFAANIGGRLLGTSGALITTTLASYMPPGDSPSQIVRNAVQVSLAACIVATVLYVIAVAFSFFLPEPKQEALPE